MLLEGRIFPEEVVLTQGHLLTVSHGYGTIQVHHLLRHKVSNVTMRELPQRSRELTPLHSAKGEDTVRAK